MGSFEGRKAKHWRASLRGRLRQGLTALLRLRKPVQMPPAYRKLLPEAVVERWNQLSAYEQHHLIAVASDLRASGKSRDLVLAGLLHDIGKPSRITIGARVSVVLINRFSSSTSNRIRSMASPPTGLQTLHLLLKHAENGADMLASHGVAQGIVWLVRHHEDSLSHPWLRALQEADNRH